MPLSAHPDRRWFAYSEEATILGLARLAKVRPPGWRLARAFRPAGPGSAGVQVMITVASRRRGFGAPRRGW